MKYSFRVVFLVRLMEKLICVPRGDFSIHAAKPPFAYSKANLTL